MIRNYFLIDAAAVLLSAALLFTVPTAAQAEWFTDAEISAVYDTSSNLAVKRQDRKGDISQQSFVTLGHYAPIFDSTVFTVSADAKYSNFARFDGLDNLETGLTASLKYKWGLGSYAPWLKVFGSAAHIDFREDFRDENTVQSGFVLGKRIYERIFTQGGYEYDAGSARDSRFDTRNSVLSARLDYLLTETVQAWIGYAVSSGVYIVYIPLRPGRTIPRAVTVDTFKDQEGAVQAYSTTKILSLGLSKAVATHWSLKVSADYIDIYARGRHYPNSLYKAGIVFAY